MKVTCPGTHRPARTRALVRLPDPNFMGGGLNEIDFKYLCSGQSVLWIYVMPLIPWSEKKKETSSRYTLWSQGDIFLPRK